MAISESRLRRIIREEATRLMVESSGRVRDAIDILGELPWVKGDVSDEGLDRWEARKGHRVTTTELERAVTEVEGVKRSRHQFIDPSMMGTIRTLQAIDDDELALARRIIRRRRS